MALRDLITGFKKPAAAVTKYPLDDNTDQYPGIITFTPIQEKYVTGKQLVGATVDAYYTQQTSSLGFGGVDAIARQQISANRAKAQKLMNTSRASVPGPSIQLYLPQAISIQDGVNYDTFDFGAIGAGVLNQVRDGGQTLKAAAQTAISDAGKSAIQLITNPSGLSGTAADLAAIRVADSVIPGETVEKVTRAAIGFTNDPNTRTLFKSVKLRTFSFTFKMIASSEAEAMAIKQIIKAFRTEMYPKAEIPGGLNTSVGYVFPNKYQIDMRYNGYPVATKFLPANLMDVNVVYNPSSMGWHAKGEPSEVDLTLTFGEPRTLSKQDIINGY